MAIPTTIPIQHEPDYRTDTIGRFAGGQFIGGVAAGQRDDSRGVEPWEAHKRWYAYLHRFDDEGRHLGSEIRFAGTTADGENAVIDRAEATLRELLAGLPDRRYGDVAVRLFRVVEDGVLFGLTDETDEFGDAVELWPDCLGFRPPWDGEYDT